MIVCRAKYFDYKNEQVHGISEKIVIFRDVSIFVILSNDQ